MDKYRLWDVDRTGSRPDNFTDKNFLESLVINANVNKRSYWKVLQGTHRAREWSGGDYAVDIDTDACLCSFLIAFSSCGIRHP